MNDLLGILAETIRIATFQNAGAAPGRHRREVPADDGRHPVASISRTIGATRVP